MPTRIIPTFALNSFGKIIDFLRLHFLHNAGKIAGIGHISVIKNKFPGLLCGS